ncbi:MAG TPA: TIGR03118 family protein [Bryobacteraceae bacterium]
MHRYIVFLLTIGPALAAPIGFVQTNLASDIPGLGKSTDPDLVNAWGMGASGSSPVWIGTNGTGKSVLYDGNGVKLGLVVTIPGDGSVTGVTFANIAGSFNGDTFLFVNEDGTVSGWRGALGSTAETLVTGGGTNVYKGVTDAVVGGAAYAYLANFGTGSVDVMKGTGAAPNLTGNFVDPNLPAGYAPFDVQVLGNVLYVTYAVQDAAKHDDVAGAGHGVVDAFDLQGNFLQRVASNGGALDSPWGLAIAPAGFGDVGGDLLVGNFGDGTIHAYDPTTGVLLETLRDAGGNPVTIDGLWGLRFGNGGSFGSPDTLYFTAGPNGEADGLFGDLAEVPEPGTLGVTGLGLLGLAWARRRYRNRSRQDR